MYTYWCLQYVTICYSIVQILIHTYSVHNLHWIIPTVRLQFCPVCLAWVDYWSNVLLTDPAYFVHLELTPVQLLKDYECFWGLWMEVEWHDKPDTFYGIDRCSIHGYITVLEHIVRTVLFYHECSMCSSIPVLVLAPIHVVFFHSDSWPWVVLRTSGIYRGYYIHVHVTCPNVFGKKKRFQHWKCGQNCFYEYAYSLWIKNTLKGRYNIGNVGQTDSLSMLTLFESRYTLKGRYTIGNVGKTASMSMLTLFESRYTLKGRYSIGNVCKTASMSMLTLFESRYTLKGRYSIGNVGQLLLRVCLLSLNQDIHWREDTALVMLAKLLLWVCLLSLNQDIHWREGTALVMLAKLIIWVCLLSLDQDIH